MSKKLSIFYTINYYHNTLLLIIYKLILRTITEQ